MKIKNKKQKKQLVPVQAKFDRINQTLKFRFNVKNINYVTNNGIIQKSWLLVDADGVDEAILLLQKQTAPIYILGEHYNAIFSWDSLHDTIISSLWRRGKKSDEIYSSNFDEIKTTMFSWLNRCIKGDEHDI